jgi:putative ABC transport system substrate-binding protein
MTATIARREFIAGLGSAAASPLAARAQQPRRVRRVGVLTDENDVDEQLVFTTIPEELEKLGWAVGRNLEIQLRSASADADRANADVADLLRFAPDVIFVASRPGLVGLQRATRTIPIVFAGISEPVAQGFVASLAHPGGNTTGFSNLEPTFGAKWLQMLKEIAPDIRHVAVVLHTEANPFYVAFSRSAEAAAPIFDVEVALERVHEPTDIEAVIIRLARDPGGGLIFLPDVFIETHRDQIVEMVARYRLPAAYPHRPFPEVGGLFSYGTDILDMTRRAAVYVDRILRGDKPADLPVQQPVKWELVINMKTAKALGLKVPNTLLVLADKVIE